MRKKGSKVYHYNPKCKKYPTDPSMLVVVTDTVGLHQCGFCDGTIYSRMRRLGGSKSQQKEESKPVELNGDFPKKVLIPIFVTSDGTEFGCEIDALRHENELLKRRLAK